MAQKAVRVTADNKDMLTTRFYDQGSGVPIAIGYFLLAGFGEDGDYDMVSPANFYAKFEVGETLRNGFFEAVPKALVP